MVENEEIKNESKDKKNSIFWVKLGSIGVFIISWIWLIVRNQNNPDLSLREPLIITIIISIVAIIAFFSYANFAKKPEDKDGIPSIMTEEEIYKKLYSLEESKWNHIKKNDGIILIDDATINKNTIYAYKINMVLDNESYIAIVNANYRNRPITLLDSTKATEQYIRKKMNNKSENPYSDPDVEVTTIENALTGNTQTTKRKTHATKKESPKKESVT